MGILTDKSRLYVSTGSKALDEIIGGYRPKTIIEWYGKTTSGKTTLSSVMLIAQVYKHLKKNKQLTDNTKFVIVDGDSGFDVDRALDVWEKLGIKGSEIDKHVERLEPVKFAEQHDFITKELSPMIKRKNWKLAALSLDPMVAIYAGIIERTVPAMKMVTSQQYGGKLALQLQEARSIIVEHDAFCCVSSWPKSEAGAAFKETSTDNDEESPVIGGRQMGLLPKVIVRLGVLDRAKGIRAAWTFKHRSLPAGRVCVFKMTDKGIQDVKQPEKWMEKARLWCQGELEEDVAEKEVTY
tara:strand:- start:4304 stop:5191 length:888 start_codon:yes stop_codon:yes gene_type:complete